MPVWCLHGNLQLPEVWTPFESRWHDPESGQPFELICPDFWEMESASFSDWTTRFTSQVRNLAAKEKQLLIGYSMGGRLALHAVLAAPELFDGCVVVSAHPGLTSEEARQQQRTWDLDWADRYRNMPWTDLLASWDALPVFAGRPHRGRRPELAFSRDQLIHGLTAFSKAEQADLTPKLTTLTAPPILYLTGEDDPRYTAIGAELARKCGVIHHEIIPQAGHRVPWEAPNAFVDAVQHFIERR